LDLRVTANDELACWGTPMDWDLAVSYAVLSPVLLCPVCGPQDSFTMITRKHLLHSRSTPLLGICSDSRLASSPPRHPPHPHRTIHAVQSRLLFLLRNTSRALPILLLQSVDTTACTSTPFTLRHPSSTLLLSTSSSGKSRPGNQHNTVLYASIVLVPSIRRLPVFITACIIYSVFDRGVVCLCTRDAA
jgi:hypothetical protein